MSIYLLITAHLIPLLLLPKLLQSLMDSYSHSYDNIIICGDFNVDFNRGGRNCEHLHSFMHEHNFVYADMNSCIKYTYRRDDHTSFSWLDHVLTLSRTAHLITQVTSSESVNNFSDHRPLFFNFMTTSNHPLPRPIDIPSSISDSRSSNHSPHSVDWDKITDSDRSKYCDHIRDHLPVIPEELVSCRDPKCTLHLDSIDSVCIQLIECIQDGARRYLPKVHPKRPAIPGWKNCAQDSAKFWHQVWHL